MRIYNIFWEYTEQINVSRKNMENSIAIREEKKEEPLLLAPGNSSARKHLIANILSNIAYVGAQSVLTLWMTPYLIGYLGLAVFGMIPLAQNIVSYTAVLMTALNNAFTRYLTIDLEQGNLDEANKTFNTGLFSVIFLFILLSPAALVVALAFPNIFNIPAGWEIETKWLFVLIAFNFIISVMGGYFSVSTFVHSQFLKYNLANFIGLLTRICTLIILFSFFSPHLWFAGVSYVFGAVLSFLGYVVLWRKLTPGLKINISAFDRFRLKEQLEMGSWVVINMVGSMFLSRVDLIIVNAYYGAIMTGGYASIIQFSFLMEYLVTAASNVIRPVILIKFARQDFQGLKEICIQSVKLLGYGMGLPVGLLCGFSKPFINLWLGSSYQYLSVLLIAILIHQALNYSVRPMLFIHNAYNRVRWPGITTLICGVGSTILGILLASWDLWGAVGVALAIGLSWTIKNTIYMPIYTAHIMKLKWWSYFPSLIPSVTGTILVGGFTYLLSLIKMPESWFSLVGYCAVVTILYLVFVWTVGLNRNDRRFLIGFIPELKRTSRPLNQ